MNRPGRFVANVSKAVLCFPLLAALAIGLLGAGRDFIGNHFGLVQAAAGLCGLGLIGLVFGTDAFYRIPRRAFIFGTIAIALVIHVAVLFRYHFVPAGDFLSMHTHASEMIRRSIGYNLGRIDDMWHERDLFYLYPLYLATGPSLFAVKILNIAMMLAAAMALFEILRMGFDDERIARVGFVLFFMFPARYLYSEIPSNDMPGLFYLVLFLYALAKTHVHAAAGSLRKAAVFSILAGLFMLAAGLSRAITMHLFVTLIVMCVIGYILIRSGEINSPLKTIVYLAVFMFAVPYLVCAAGMIRWGHFQSAYYSDIGHIFCANDSIDTGNYFVIEKYRALMSQVYDRGDLARYGIGRLVSEIHYNFSDFIRMLVRKIALAHSLGGELDLLATSSGSWYAPSAIRLLNIFARMLFFLFGAAGLLSLMKTQIKAAALPVLIFSAVATGLLMLGEVQPRYSYFLQPYFSMVAAVGLLACIDVVKRKSGISQFAVAMPVISALVLIAAVAGVKILVSHGIVGRSFVFTDLSSPRLAISKEMHAKFGRNLEPIQHRPFGYSLNLPESYQGKLKATWSREVAPGRKYDVTFFLQNATTSTAAVRYSIMVNRKLFKAEQNVPLPALQYIDAGPIEADGGKINVEVSVAGAGSKTRPASLIVAYMLVRESKPRDVNRGFKPTETGTALFQNDLIWHEFTNIDASRITSNSFADAPEPLFAYPLADPLHGDMIGIQARADVNPEALYELSMEVFDGYGGAEYPNRIRELIAIDGRVMWSHDIGGDRAQGWIPVKFRFQPTGKELDVRVMLRAAGFPERGWNWGKCARIGVRNARLKKLGPIAGQHEQNHARP
ncbi:hypothetical protein LLG95_18015 [bacterium]|nr:hypothetical protein [bacterium]